MWPQCNDRRLLSNLLFRGGAGSGGELRWAGGNGDGTRAIFPDGTHSEKVIVGRNGFQNVLSRRFDKIVDLPTGIGRFPPENFKSRAIRNVTRRPSYFRIRRDAASEADVCGRRGSERQLTKGLSVVASHVAHEREIQILYEIAILDTVLGSRRLVLVVVIFKGLGKPDARKPRFPERAVIAAAAQPVEAKNQAD